VNRQVSDSAYQPVAYPALATLLQRVLHAARRDPRRNASRDEDRDLIARVIADLRALNGSTEKDFLALGGRLGEFLRAARRISSEMATLGELISGDGARHASQALTGALERSREIEARARAGDRALAGVCAAAGRIERTFRGFRDTISMFHVLGSLTRIETARLGSAGAEFGSLVEEVKALTGSIEASGQGILAASAILHRNMQLAIAQVAGRRAGELQELPSLVAAVTSGLESLEERHRQAGETSLRQSGEYDAVSVSIEDLTTAIQFHDITRQQIEHVAEALERLGGRPAARLDVRAVLSLQSSQLSNTGRVFADSVGRIERDLDSILERVAHMAEAGQTLLGHSADDQDSFFVQMERRSNGILHILGICAQAESETQSALGQLEEAVARMRQSVAEIRETETRIRRMAINATIRAVHIGGAGAALQVVADVMQHLAVDSEKVTDEVSGSLDAISDAAHRLSGGSSPTAASAPSEEDQVLTEMRATILELHSSSEMAFSRLHQIGALSSQLRDGIEAVRDGFSAGALFTEKISEARSALERMGGPAEAGRLENVDPTGGAPLEDFARHYTMQAEREVHESVVGGATARELAPVAAPSRVADEEDLGDNVELF